MARRRVQVRKRGSSLDAELEKSGVSSETVTAIAGLIDSRLRPLHERIEKLEKRNAEVEKALQLAVDVLGSVEAYALVAQSSNVGTAKTFREFIDALSTASTAGMDALEEHTEFGPRARARFIHLVHEAEDREQMSSIREDLDDTGDILDLL